MKKMIPILCMLFLFYFYINKDTIIIPTYSIRFRVIANSDSKSDQETKIQVYQEVEKQLNQYMAKSRSSKEAKQYIEEELPKIQSIVNQYTLDSKIALGQNYFPEKEYRGVVYQSGNYDSLVITLGSGLGENWWCVMYPPLCMLEAEEQEEVEYRFLIQDLLQKYSS